MKETEVTAQAMGVQIQPVELRGPNDFERLFRDGNRGAGRRSHPADEAFLFRQRTRIVSLQRKADCRRSTFPRTGWRLGGLCPTGPPRRQYRRAAIYVDKILKGTKPADLPVEQTDEV